MANKPKDAKKEKPKDAGSGGGKQKKKKWSKGKSRDKLNNLVLFDKATYDKFLKEVPSYKLITPSVVSERLKIRGSLARAALRELFSKGLIKCISKHSSQDIYTRAVEEQPKEEKDEKQVKEAKPKQQKQSKAQKAEAAAAAAEEKA